MTLAKIIFVGEWVLSRTPVSGDGHNVIYIIYMS